MSTDDSMRVDSGPRCGFRYPVSKSDCIMTKRPAARPAKHRVPAPPQAKGRHPFTLNRNLNQQTRKVLSKHYRAKYGVK